MLDHPDQAQNRPHWEPAWSRSSGGPYLTTCQICRAYKPPREAVPVTPCEQSTYGTDSNDRADPRIKSVAGESVSLAPAPDPCTTEQYAFRAWFQFPDSRTIYRFLSGSPLGAKRECERVFGRSGKGLPSGLPGRLHTIAQKVDAGQSRVTIVLAIGGNL